MKNFSIRIIKAGGKLPFYLGICVVIFFSNDLLAQNTNLKITQVYYTGGSDASAAYDGDFVELYNNSDSDVSLNSEYHLSLGPNGWFISLTGTIKARGFYLVRYKVNPQWSDSHSYGGDPIPTPDITDERDISRFFYVILYHNPTFTPIDGVNIGDSGYNESYVGQFFLNNQAPLADTSQLAIQRKRVNGAWQDTGSSASDFELGTPFPRSSSYVASPTISGAATAAAFTTTYGTASAAQSFNISGSNLTANLVATAPTGFEVSADGTTYGTTATFTQTGGSASGTLLIRLKADAAPGANYNSQNIVLSSTGAADVNISTTATGNLVVSRFAAWSGTETMTTQSVGRYAIGGASNSTAMAAKPTSSVVSGNLTLTAIVRTNDPKLKVEGETSADLIAWATNAVTSTNTTDQTGVDTGHARKTFSVPQSSDGKKFLRLKATLSP